MILNNKMYDQLKFLALVLLPALGTLYFALAGIWGLPAAEQVVGTIVAVDTFLGIVLRISSAQETSFDGYLEQKGSDPDTGIPHLAMTVTKDPSKIVEGQYARLKIGAPPKS